MKTKFNFDWKSMVLGMALCLALVVFVASIAQGGQSDARPLDMKKMVTMNTLMDKLELMDQRLLILEGKMNHLQEGMTDGLKTLEMLWNRGEGK